MIGAPGSVISRNEISSIFRAAVLHQRRQAPADAHQFHAHARVAGEDAVHVIALAVGDHVERRPSSWLAGESPIGSWTGWTASAAEGAWRAYADPDNEAGTGMFGGWTAAMLLKAVLADPRAEGEASAINVNYVSRIPPKSELGCAPRRWAAGRSVTTWRSEVLLEGARCPRASPHRAANKRESSASPNSRARSARSRRAADDPSAGGVRSAHRHARMDNSVRPGQQPFLALDSRAYWPPERSRPARLSRRRLSAACLLAQSGTKAFVHIDALRLFLTPLPRNSRPSATTSS